MPTAPDLRSPLADDERLELEHLLAESCDFGIEGVLGLLHAVAVAPSLIPPPTWLPLVLTGAVPMDEAALTRAFALVMRPTRSPSRSGCPCRSCVFPAGSPPFWAMSRLACHDPRVRSPLLPLCLVALGCSSGGSDESPPPLPPPPPAVAPAEAPAVEVDATVETGPCPVDMRLVEGAYCPAVQEKCAARKQLDGRSAPEKNNCQSYVEPSVCLVSRRASMRYCMDAFEWPNEKGEIPRVLTSWQDARELCASKGKRLCTEEEFTFACEGVEMRPYVYGFERDPSKCNFDKPYRPRTFTFLAWDACQSDAACKAAFDGIDQRLPAGSNEACRSPEGIYDLNGNVNEWVMLPGKKGPHRSGLKGGWWGPVRNRCRPTVTFHDEGDFGYEVGFRCCGDAG